METIQIGDMKIKYGIDESLGDDEWLLVSIPPEYTEHLKNMKIELAQHVRDNGDIMIVARLVPNTKPKD
jgi:hypothetical protein